MRYLPTIDLWNRGIYSALVSGQLSLLPGQWVQCGAGHKSRYIGIRHGVINAVHWQGTGKASNKLYLTRARIARLQRLLDKGVISNVQFRDYAILL